MSAVMTLLDIGLPAPDVEPFTRNGKDWHGVFWTDLLIARCYWYLLLPPIPVESHLRGYFLPGNITNESKGFYGLKFENKHKYSFVH
jgi:hypothetical protein